MRKRTAAGYTAVTALMGVFCLVSFLRAAPAAAPGLVEYTWNLVALGQGGWIGGPLFEDGTVGGGGAFSTNNGKLTAQLRPTTWSENDDEEITVCFDIIQKKGPAGALPTSLCFGPAAVTGTPIHVDFLGVDHIFRITEIH